LKETVDKSIIIANQNTEFECLRALVKEPTATNDAPQQGISIVELEDTELEVDVAELDHIVENVTYRVLEPVTTPLGQRRASPMFPPSPKQ
jgi:hypothetical protein